MDLWVHLVLLRRGYILGTSGGHGRRRSSWQIPSSVDGGQVEQKQHHAKRILRTGVPKYWGTGVRKKALV